MLEWWLWALLTPIAVGLARRFPMNRRTAWRHALVHAGAGTVLAFLKITAERAIFAWMTGVWTYWLVSTLALQMVVYSGIVAAAHAVVYYERSRERDQLAARLSDMRLQLLAMQLQPHFLFNTLNTIAELVHEEPDVADSMITGLHVGTKEYLLRDTLAAIERLLDPERFARIHRSAIVQLDRIAELHPATHGDLEVVLPDGVRLTLSRTWRERVQQMFRVQDTGTVR